MYELYTALGWFELEWDTEDTFRPIVYLSGKKYELTTPEVWIWRFLDFKIRGIESIRQHYEENSKTFLSRFQPIPFEQCMSRLEFRGLIATGCGNSSGMAQYRLSRDLYPRKIPPLYPRVRLKALYEYHVKFGTPLREITKTLFPRIKLSRQEKKILSLCNGKLTVSELLDSLIGSCHNPPSAPPEIKIIEELHRKGLIYFDDQKERTVV